MPAIFEFVYIRILQLASFFSLFIIACSASSKQEHQQMNTWFKQSHYTAIEISNFENLNSKTSRHLIHIIEPRLISRLVENIKMIPLEGSSPFQPKLEVQRTELKFLGEQGSTLVQLFGDRFKLPSGGAHTARYRIEMSTAQEILNFFSVPIKNPVKKNPGTNLIDGDIEIVYRSSIHDKIINLGCQPAAQLMRISLR